MITVAARQCQHNLSLNMSGPFDFVVVGGGTSGLVVATRLSEMPQFRVLVLEAGEDLTDDPRVKTPALFASLFGSEADWAFNTEPQVRYLHLQTDALFRTDNPQKAGLNGRVVTINQGKALGGSSAMNGQVWVPPTKANFDAWESLGNEGWDWETLQKSVTKAYTHPSVEAQLEVALGVDGWAAKNEAAKGPLLTSYPKPAVHEAWAKTMKNLGYAMSGDPFLGGASGSFSNLHTVDSATKERSYAASAYYQPCKGRENLVLVTGAHVEKILFDNGQGEGGVQATGVQYRHDGVTQTVSATKEVVLAAGAFQSPKILELSGIGDAQLLAKHGIELIRDLPGVGENLQDHPACGIAYEVVDSLETLDGLARQEPEVIGQAMHEYATSRSGPLTSTGFETYAYLPILDHVSQDSPGYERLRQLLNDHVPPESDRRASALYAHIRQTLLDPKAGPSAVYLTLVPHPARPKPPPGRPELVARLSGRPRAGQVPHHRDDALEPPVGGDDAPPQRRPGGPARHRPGPARAPRRRGGAGGAPAAGGAARGVGAAGEHGAGAAAVAARPGVGPKGRRGPGGTVRAREQHLDVAPGGHVRDAAPGQAWRPGRRLAGARRGGVAGRGRERDAAHQQCELAGGRVWCGRAGGRLDQGSLGGGIN